MNSCYNFVAGLVALYALRVSQAIFAMIAGRSSIVDSS